MNIYRDRIADDNGVTRREESWITATRRLLLSKFSYGGIETDAGEIQPYSDISSGDSSSLYRFVDAIDSLETWMGMEADLTAVFQFLDSWLCMGNPPKELSGESVIYHLNLACIAIQFECIQKRSASLGLVAQSK